MKSRNIELKICEKKNTTLAILCVHTRAVEHSNISNILRMIDSHKYLIKFLWYRVENRVYRNCIECQWTKKEDGKCKRGREKGGNKTRKLNK